MKQIGFALFLGIAASSCARKESVGRAESVTSNGGIDSSAGNANGMTSNLAGGINQAGGVANGIGQPMGGSNDIGGPSGAQAGSAPSGGLGGTVKFHETFSGAWPGPWTLIDRPGDLGNKEIGCYQPTKATINAGMLELKTQADTSCKGYAYTSGMAQWTSYSFTYGTIEVRAKLAGGKGPWPAIWLLGANCQATNIKSADNSGACSWPNPGSDEIDIAEMLGSGRSSVNQQVHTASGKPGCSAAVSDTSQNFHSYRLVWTKSSLVWSIDGKTTCTVDQSVPTTAMFLILNTAVGGMGGGTVDPSTLPQSSYIDEVTVWQ